MSSILSVYGTLHFPPGVIARWGAMPLAARDDESVAHDELGEPFDQACDEATVAEVLECDDDRMHFVHLVVDSDRLLVRAALGDDTWTAWCGRIAALARAAARVGARGHLETEDDGCFTGRLRVEAGGVRFEPRSPRLKAPTDKASEADMRELFEKQFRAFQAEAATRKAKTAARKKATPKKTSTKKTAKKTAAKR